MSVVLWRTLKVLMQLLDQVLGYIMKAWQRDKGWAVLVSTIGERVFLSQGQAALKHLPREKIQLATKLGITGTVDPPTIVIKGTPPEYVRSACEASLKRLGVDYIDLYYQHRVDTSVPIEETIGELKKLVEEGKVKYIGLSEASPDTIRRAHAVHPITAVQMEWSLWTRDIEKEIIPLCRHVQNPI
ncbi:hypothetical protein Pyn_36571 [Prunus yedoensis var. nudiflora]|uniref:NADP-dependent oxidoreductase domain-containing protein n=1 Tax=Prunus yedoensis var. nudiflora TaxID=2094558 RepID=A0A314USX1_PRUYE|nr:hypothetical protein Pyn_36571 [Prunus yedoensis var. nudiflora]